LPEIHSQELHGVGPDCFQDLVRNASVVEHGCDGVTVDSGVLSGHQRSGSLQQGMSSESGAFLAEDVLLGAADIVFCLAQQA
jgi:hypothetical protein